MNKDAILPILLNASLPLGVDPALASPDGRCLAMESYLHKGRLTLANRCKRKEIPGLWVAGKVYTSETARRSDSVDVDRLCRCK
mgnify:CR=1 FL=1